MKQIIAYKIKPWAELKNGNPARDWMDLTNKKFAYGCLPLVIANEMGWDVICKTSFRVLWTGNNDPGAIIIQFSDDQCTGNDQVLSHFGYGVLTFHPGFLFKTEPGHNLYIKGAPNHLKDAIQPLEGVVETDWLPFTFTINWKFTRANTWVEFQEGEPIARVLPYQRNYIEDFDPVIDDLDSDPKFKADYEAWKTSRMNHIISKNPGKERDYLKGIDKNKQEVEFHQRKIRLQEFKQVE